MALLLAAFFFLLYLDHRANNYLVLTETSPDQKYTLKLNQIAQPDKPYGDTKVEVFLYEDEKNINHHKYYVSCDGKLLNSESFMITWKNDHVEVVNSGAGRTTTTLKMGYKGEISISYGINPSEDVQENP